MKKLTKIAALLAACLMLFTACSTEDSGSQSTGADTASSDASTQSSEDSSSKTESSEAQECSAAETTAQPVGTEFYDDAVFIGDSVSLRLYYYCQGHSGALGKAQFLTSGSLGSGNALDKITTDSVHPVYQGEKMLIEDGVKASGAKKVFIMLGMNELGWVYESVYADYYAQIIDIIRETHPDAVIYVQSILPVSQWKDGSNEVYTNANVVRLQKALCEMCEEKGVYYLNVAEAVQDENGFLPSDATPDGMHLTAEYCKIWMEYLRIHTV